MFWLEHTGETHLANRVQKFWQANQDEPDIALENVIQDLDPNLPKPQLQVTPSQMECKIERDEDIVDLDLTIDNASRGYLYGRIEVEINPGRK